MNLFYSSYDMKSETYKRIDRLGDSILIFDKSLINSTYKLKLNDKKTVKVIIKKFNSGMIWTPIIKSSKYRITGICIDAFDQDSTKLPNGFTNVNANIKISGNVRIIGFCSYREAKRLIIEQSMKDVLKLTIENNSRLIKQISKY